MKSVFTTFFTTTLLILPLLLLLLCPLLAVSKTAEEWKSRSVYQILTDRFARSDGADHPCTNLGDYCGGTYKGIQNNLDYIQDMGFDAIWISPIVANTPGGYHGYWVSNLFEVNENFGSKEDLKQLIQTCHERDVWVMVDVVANHVGYVDNSNYSTIYPFSDAAHYNPYSDCAHTDYRDGAAFETCWLSGLPDLDQNHPFVRQTLLDWITDFVKEYDFDALRIDTIPHVSREFWTQFSEASGIFTMGEILNLNLTYLASYQGPVDGVLNYALYSAMQFSFQNGGSMKSIESYYEDAYATWPDITTLGNFINNHDNPRFLSTTENQVAFKSALAFSMCSIGIPMVYYGDEYAFNGGADPANREALWTHLDHVPKTEIHELLKTLNKFRKETQFYKYEQVQRYSDNQMYAFSRGDYFFAFTNSQDEQVSRVITSHPYSEGTLLCNVLHQQQKGEEEDCVEVKDGEFVVTLRHGEVKVLAPSQNEREEQSEERVTSRWNIIKMFLASGSKFGGGRDFVQSRI